MTTAEFRRDADRSITIRHKPISEVAGKGVVGLMVQVEADGLNPDGLTAQLLGQAGTVNDTDEVLVHDINVISSGADRLLMAVTSKVHGVFEGRRCTVTPKVLLQHIGRTVSPFNEPPVTFEPPLDTLT